MSSPPKVCRYCDGAGYACLVCGARDRVGALMRERDEAVGVAKLAVAKLAGVEAERDEVRGHLVKLKARCHVIEDERDAMQKSRLLCEQEKSVLVCGVCGLRWGLHTSGMKVSCREKRGSAAALDSQADKEAK